MWTNNGYSRSVIFSLLANSKARSYGILASQRGTHKPGWSYQTPLRCIGPILTTFRSFSLLRIPSRRPLVIPTTFSNFVPLILWLSTMSAKIRKRHVNPAYPLCEQRIRRVPRFDSKGCPRLPTRWLSPAVWPLEVASAPKGQRPPGFHSPVGDGSLQESIQSLMSRLTTHLTMVTIE